jgi:hypothetical protein
MPLARIITDVADDSLELTMQLRARGFQVETVAPGAVPDTPADLEVRLEECGPEDVLAEAQTADADDLWVFVAPGALDESSRPIRAIPLVPRVPAAKIAPVAFPKPETELPTIPPALSIDPLDEDLILAELREFPIPAAPARSAQPDASRDVETISMIAATREALSAAAEVVMRPAAVRSEDAGSESSENKDAPAVPRVEPPPKKAQIPVIPIAPEPVASFVVAPAPVVARKPRSTRRLDPLPWSLALMSAALVVLAWSLVGTVRPDVPTAQTGASLLQANSPLMRPATFGATQPQPHPTNQLQAPASRSRMLAATTGPQVRQPARKSPKAKRPVPHSHGDGLIADDTVVFYDRKPGPPRANPRPEPGVKLYSDRN